MHRNRSPQVVWFYAALWSGFSPPLTLANPERISNECFDDLISDITIASMHIKDLSDEFAHQSAEMLFALEKPPPELRAKRDVISAAWAEAGALAERAARWASTLEQLIGQTRRVEWPCSL